MKGFSFNLFVALHLGACASQAASKIPNPKIADAERKLEHIRDIDRNLNEEETGAAMFLLGRQIPGEVEKAGSIGAAFEDH